MCAICSAASHGLTITSPSHLKFDFLNMTNCAVATVDVAEDVVTATDTVGLIATRIAEEVVETTAGVIGVRTQCPAENDWLSSVDTSIGAVPA